MISVELSDVCCSLTSFRWLRLLPGFFWFHPDVVPLEPKSLPLTAPAAGNAISVPTPSAQSGGAADTVAGKRSTGSLPAATTQQAEASSQKIEDKDCDGKYIHLKRPEGEDVGIDVVCDKKIDGGGSVLNEVSIDADTGGSGNSGAVTVDLSISNTVGE